MHIDLLVLILLGIVGIGLIAGYIAFTREPDNNGLRFEDGRPIRKQ